ncbi:TnsA-like heteromeric transposase endonuclease subunit [Streptomyces bobili]|uniref:TnsA-like heteromeric transposase endonuclease subunit n=1 Tax=Streptomyces bobili TaxID=67280 RepID=UPI0036F6716C
MAGSRVGLERVVERADTGAVWSHQCSWDDFFVSTDVDAGRTGLDQRDGWTRRWTVSWRANGDGASSSVQELVQEPVLSSDPMRNFTWRRDQRHRPGLQFLISTGRHHGAESLEEGRALLALDFAGDLVDVVSQPLKISFEAGGKRRHHTPDYLAVTRHGVWLVDVRPEALIKESDRESFAAAAEVALACGWRYTVAARWREHAFAGLDALASRRRLRSDPLGLRPVLLARAAGGRLFGELAAATGCEPLARAQLLHLLWSRHLGVDLASPLQDRSIVVPAGEAGR